MTDSTDATQTPRRSTPARAATADGSFGAPFWLTYAANATMMVAVSLFFRYADLVKLLGGSELELGMIVGVGMIGSLAVRVLQGVGIDTYGPRQVWLLSSCLFIVSCLGQLTVTSLHSPTVFLWRILFQISVAGFFGASITYISGRASVTRMAEVIGMLGTSGFVGMMIGTSLGDWLLAAAPVERPAMDRVFITAACLGSVSLAFSWLATRGEVRRRPRRQPSLLRLIARYHPGWLLLMGAAMGFGLGLPQVFLRPYAAELGIGGIAIFFSLYPPTAFVTRLAIRRLPEKLGIRPMILLGMFSLVVGILAFLAVRSAYHLLLPAFFIGIAHACLFPSVVAGGSAPFPARYRGLGTTLVLAMFDLGMLIGSPTVGAIVHTAKLVDLPPYPTMFISVAGVLTLAAVLYAVTSRPTHTGGRARGVVRRVRRRKRRLPMATIR